MDRHHSLNFRESAQCAQTNPGLYLRLEKVEQQTLELLRLVGVEENPERR